MHGGSDLMEDYEQDRRDEEIRENVEAHRHSHERERGRSQSEERQRTIRHVKTCG